jgi:dipeptidyl aminopeptidase/acylaminoacyl peptidase
MQKITPELLLKFNYLSGLIYDQDKTQFVYVKSVANIEKNDYGHELYHFKDGKSKLVFTFKKKGLIAFEDKNNILISHAKSKSEEKLVKDKKTIIYRLNLNTKKLTKAYVFDFEVSSLKVMNKNQLLLGASMLPLSHDLYNGDKKNRDAAVKALKANELYEDINEIPFQSNGLGFSANRRNQLFIFDLKTKKVKPLLKPNFNIDNMKISEDNSKIYLTGGEVSGVDTPFSKIYMLDLKTLKLTTIYNQLDYSISALHLLKGKLIVAASNLKQFGINQNKDFYILVGSKLKLLTKFGQSMWSSVGTDVRLGGAPSSFVLNDVLYFVSTIDDHNDLYSLDVNGKVTMVYSAPGSLDGLVVANKQVYAIMMVDQKLQELYHLDLKTKAIKQLTSFNDKILKNHYIAKPNVLVLKGKEHQVKGYVLLPENFNPTKKYPMILDIHGGPKTVYGQIYMHETQFWVNQGYIVVLCNPRGSDGKGDKFADIRGKYGTIDYDDIMNFMDLAIKQYPSIDQSKLFVTGGSYGGFMTNWIVGHTNRFKAAVTQRSISNWLSFYGTSDIGYYFAKDQTDGHPVVDTDKLWNQSPIKYARDMKTPLLIVHSDQDYRCPIEQGMQLFTVLKAQGVETKLLWMKNENHELTRAGKPQARIKNLKEIINWFNAKTGKPLI